jgi:hypothetical protein
MRIDSKPDLDVGDASLRVDTASDFAVGTVSDHDIEPLPSLDDLLPEPHVPEPIEHERTQVFARPSEAACALGDSARLAWPDDAQVTNDDDPRGFAALGSQPYAIARLRFAKSSTPPPLRERTSPPPDDDMKPLDERAPSHAPSPRRDR